VHVRLGNLASGSHPFDQPARAAQERGQVIDVKHRLDADGQRSTGFGVLGLVVEGIGRSGIEHGELAAGGGY